MKNPLGLRLVTTTLAGVMTLSMVACNKPVDGTGAAAPATTVGTEVDDSVVTTRVKTALLDNVDVKGFDIQVETRKGEVMLSGFVSNQTQIDQAVNVAKGVEGVTHVNNKLSIKDGVATVGNKIDDSVITTEVKAALLADANIKSLDITVTTHKGEVQLSGFVNNQGQIDRALDITRGVSGVTQVGNQMSIKK
ncbi:BON domain-containing protein [Rhodoferax sp. U11-2br]|uniref:BON domain-containing protein n=1 Tax=Rhodoferax sp. U11-2br TaxID=2838878 RepID=UPI001BED0762|nr:BON domain-containing protein [Rhodoferax sp. U11-2br]MBT3067478.1 BON domain-containing protein [Rhodoferax sp. U11-2br]